MADPLSFSFSYLEEGEATTRELGKRSYAALLLDPLPVAEPALVQRGLGDGERKKDVKNTTKKMLNDVSLVIYTKYTCCCKKNNG